MSNFGNIFSQWDDTLEGSNEWTRIVKVCQLGTFVKK